VTQSITKFWKRRAPPTPEVAAALERLAQLSEASPVLREAAALQGAILREIYAAPPPAVEVVLADERAAEKLHGGIPLLRGERVMLDVPTITALMQRLCDVVRKLGEAPGAAAEIAAALQSRAITIEPLVEAVLAGQAHVVHEQAAEHGLDGGLLATLLRFSLFPALARTAAQLSSLRTETVWEQGYCPVCGSWPLLGEHRGLDQTRFLRCGLCAAEWAIDRLRCPYCGSRDHQDLSYLHVEGEDQRRAVTCESCRGYIKLLASLTPIPPAELAVYDVATLHLDLVALERGYMAPV